MKQEGRPIPFPPDRKKTHRNGGCLLLMVVMTVVRVKIVVMLVMMILIVMAVMLVTLVMVLVMVGTVIMVVVMMEIVVHQYHDDRKGMFENQVGS